MVNISFVRQHKTGTLIPIMTYVNIKLAEKNVELNTNFKNDKKLVTLRQFPRD